ncbi:MAG TPA: hypothetical protein VLA59_05235 [Patescibacteria group bacterium]|nr:hypothetical protein [Patescibacteria group bacterium]
MKKLVGFLALPFLVACAATTGDSPPASESTSESPSASAPASSQSAPDGIPADVWQAIVADLESRVDAPLDDLSVLIAEAQTWSDG